MVINITFQLSLLSSSSTSLLLIGYAHFRVGMNVLRSAVSQYFIESDVQKLVIMGNPFLYFY